MPDGSTFLTKPKNRKAWIGDPRVSVRYGRLVQALRQRRLELGLSQDALAGQLRTGQRQINRAELAHRGVTVAFMLRWVSALDMDICFVRTANFKIHDCVLKTKSGLSGRRKHA